MKTAFKVLSVIALLVACLVGTVSTISFGRLNEQAAKAMKELNDYEAKAGKLIDNYKSLLATVKDKPEMKAKLEEQIKTVEDSVAKLKAAASGRGSLLIGLMGLATALALAGIVTQFVQSGRFCLPVLGVAIALCAVAWALAPERVVSSFGLSGPNYRGGIVVALCALAAGAVFAFLSSKPQAARRQLSASTSS